MFEKNTVDAYHKITAPAELRERVLHPAPKVPFRERVGFRAVAVAACLALVMTLSVATSSVHSVAVSVSGRQIGVSPLELSEASPFTRTEEPACMSNTEWHTFPLELRAPGSAEVAVTNGQLVLTGAEAETLQTGTVLSFSGQALFKWEVPETDAPSAGELRLTAQGRTQTFALVRNENGDWMIAPIQ